MEKKTLTLKKKRIIRRQDIAPERLGTAKPKAAPKPKPKPKQQPKRPTITPSETRMDNLNAALNGKTIWRDYQPLSYGIEKQLFQFIALHKLSASKRIVQRLIKQHTSHDRYLNNIITATHRHDLNGEQSAPIAPSESQHARKLLVSR